MYGNPAEALNPAAGASHEDHAHLDGKCTSWIDEALDAAGPEYADAPRPGSCCEKDSKATAEARRIRGIVRAADPVRRATALRASNDPRNATRGAHDFSPIDEDSDDLCTDSEDDDETRSGDDTKHARFFTTKDPALVEIQAKRIAEMKLAAEKARAERLNIAANAAYGSIREQDIPKHLREGPTFAVLHFPSEGSESSARVDEVFAALAPAFPRTRFTRVRCPTGTSPAIAAMSGGATNRTPAVACFRKQKLRTWTLEYDAFGGLESLEEERCVRWLARTARVLPGHPEAASPGTGRTGGAMGIAGTRGGYDDDSGEEEGLRRRGDEDDSDADADAAAAADDECGYNGVGAPCGQCGRRFPHTHFRALRQGGARRSFGEDEDSDDDE